MPPARHELMLAASVEELRRRALDRAPDPPGLSVDAELWVSPEEWLTFRDAVAAASLRLHERAERPHSPGTQHVSVTALLFGMER